MRFQQTSPAATAGLWLGERQAQIGFKLGASSTASRNTAVFCLTVLAVGGGHYYLDSAVWAYLRESAAYDPWPCEYGSTTLLFEYCFVILERCLWKPLEPSLDSFPFYGSVLHLHPKSCNYPSVSTVPPAPKWVLSCYIRRVSRETTFDTPNRDKRIVWKPKKYTKRTKKLLVV